MTPPDFRTLFLDHAAVLGGAELSLLAVTRAWPGPRQVALFEDGPFRDRLTDAGVPVEVVSAGGAVREVSREGGVLADLRAVPGVLRLAARVARRARRADAVVANSQKSFVVGAMAAPLARRPLVWYLRDMLTADHFSGGHRRLVVALANRCAALVLCNSQATADAFVAAGGDGRKTRVVHNGVDPAPFDRVTAADARAARQSVGLGNGPVVGVFSRLSEWKGQHVLLDALAHLPDVQALFVGDALFGEDDYAAQLRAQADRLGVSSRVRWAGFRDDVPALMKACTVVAHTSTAPEPFGRVIVEAMLAGRPVVAADAGGPREILGEGQAGRLVRPGDPTMLAAAVRLLLDDATASRSQAEVGQRVARERFSVQAMVCGVLAVVGEAVGHPKAGFHAPASRRPLALAARQGKLETSGSGSKT